jgi:hypothetical protein
MRQQLAASIIIIIIIIIINKVIDIWAFNISPS